MDFQAVLVAPKKRVFRFHIFIAAFDFQMQEFTFMCVCTPSSKNFLLQPADYLFIYFLITNNMLL